MDDEQQGKKKKRSRARKVSQVPSRIWRYGIFQVPQRPIAHRREKNRRQGIGHYDLIFVNGLWRLGPRPKGPHHTAASNTPLQSRRGYLKFRTPAAARASGLGDPKQLEAVINNTDYVSDKCVPAQALTNRKKVETQLAMANRYRNALVEVVQKKRIREFSAYLEVAWRKNEPELCNIASELDGILRELDAQFEAQRKVRAKARARTTDPVIAERIKELKAERSDKYSALNAWRTRYKDEHEVMAVREWENLQRKKQSREFNDVAWGTRGAVDAAIEQSINSLMSWEFPGFRRYEGEGKLRVQIIKKNGPDGPENIVTTESLLAGTDLRVRLLLSPDNPKNAMLWLRIGSEEKRKPVWAQFPVVYQRPLPPLAEIKQVWVQRRKEAGRGAWQWEDSGHRWEACFQVESETFDKPLRLGGPTGALNLGFRKLPDGSLRVGYFVGSDGYRLDIILPSHGSGVEPNGRPLWRKNRHGIDASLDYARSKNAGTPKHNEADGRSYYLEKTRDHLVTWIKEHPELTPEWLKDHMPKFRQTRSQGYLQWLIYLWFNHPDPKGAPPEATGGNMKRRIPAGLPSAQQELFERLLIWSRTDRHDEQHEAGLRSRTLRFRDTEYRRIGRNLFERYSEIRLVKFKKTALVRKRSPEEGESELEAVQRRQFNTVAMATLVGALRLAASNTGGTLVEIPLKALREQLTIKHHVCGTLSQSDPRANISLYCPHCDVEFDQDQNAAENLLAMDYQEGDPASEEAAE